MPSYQRYTRFLWSHDLAIHRWSVRVVNRLMRYIPFEIKYGVGRQLRRNRPPYCLIREGARIVQIGAPQDTLHSGRSRGMYFCLFAGPTGQVMIVEPDAESAREFEKLARQNHIANSLICPEAAWSDKRSLKVYINDAHPASNFTEGTKNYDPKRLRGYRLVVMPAETLDDMLLERGLLQVDLVSITTNGAEREILKGLFETIARGLPYIALARTGENYTEMMGTLGYDLYTHDDRGFTFRQARILTSTQLMQQL